MTMITPSYLGETIEYSSLHACRSTLEDPTHGLSFDGALVAERAAGIPCSLFVLCVVRGSYDAGQGGDDQCRHRAWR